MNLDTRCALKLSFNSPEEGVSREINTIKLPYLIETAEALPPSEQPSTSVCL